MTYKRPDSDRSKYLTDAENNNLISLIERESGVSLATAPVQLWLSQKPSHTNWINVHSGIICFVKDYAKKSYYFRLYSLISKLLWEQEMYTPFSYHKLTKHFHFFASDECNAGINFANEDDADKFYDTVNNKIISKTGKLRSKIIPTPQSNLQKQQQQQQIISNNEINSNDQPHSSTLYNQVKYVTMKGDKKKILDKSQISGPTDFHIVRNCVLDSTSHNFDINLPIQDDSSCKIRELLSQLNIPFAKKATKFAEDFFPEHGGYEVLKRQKSSESL